MIKECWGGHTYVGTQQVTHRKTKKRAHTRPCYLSSSDGHLGLLIYRLVTETAYQQQPHPSAHAHSEGLIWIFEGKTHTPHQKNAHTHTDTHTGSARAHTHTHKTPHKSWPVIALHCLAAVAFSWCDCQQMASTELSESAWGPHTGTHTHMQAHTKALTHRESVLLHGEHMHSVR